MAYLLADVDYSVDVHRVNQARAALRDRLSACRRLLL